MLTRVPSFDGTESFVTDVLRPDRYEHLYAALSDERACIARGAGLSYCAASAGDDVRSVQSVSFNRLLAFDDETGVIEVETGVRLGDLFRFTVPRGWILPVMPGHPAISVGGCIGCNVHGKNQVRDGCFMQVVEELTLFHPDRGLLTCSLQNDADLFRLTLGGFGLTGYVITAKLKLQRISSGSTRVRRIMVGSLCETVPAMEAEKDASSLYSWNDFNRGGARFGAGFVYAGRPGDEAPSGELVEHPLAAEQRGRRVPASYTRWTTRALMSAYAATQRLGAAESSVPLAAASFPPNGREFYFHLFGRRGFREYQLLVPRAAWDGVCTELPGLLRRHAAPVTLASLKLFGGSGRLLHFDGSGVCLALDAPETPQTRALFAALDELTVAAGGIANLSKDSRLAAPVVRRMFPEYERFRGELARFDPRRRFDSALRRRIDV